MNSTQAIDTNDLMVRLDSAKRRYNVMNASSHNMESASALPFNDLTFDMPSNNKATIEPMNDSLLNIFTEGAFAFSSQENNNAIVSESEDSSVEESPRKKRKSSKNLTNKFRPYQAEKWQERFDELIEFNKVQGHCLVPHTYPENPALARWVKRQRYQYKLLQEEKQSSMTQDRIKILEDIGFIWDSHEAAWQERLKELLDFQKENGSCLVPSNYPQNPQLATWVKCQRRQYKLYWEGRPSNMTVERIMTLEKIKFNWELRSSSYSKKAAEQEAKALNAMLPAMDHGCGVDSSGGGDYNMLMDLLTDISEDDVDLDLLDL